MTSASGLLMIVMFAAMAAAGVHNVEAAGPRRLLGPAQVSLGAVKIRKVTVAGSGCPHETPLVSISADNQAVTIPFLEYQVAVPAALKDRQKSCTISIDLDYPAGWTYVASKWTYQGWVELQKGLVAYQSAKYYYQGGQPACERIAKWDALKKPIAGRSYTIQEVCPEGISFSPCGEVRGLNILTRMWIDNKKNYNAEGVIKAEVVDGEVKSWNLFVCHLYWQWCH
ncbi:hypothetical protein CBR_g11068 [Chara braunii]|uniref:Uncharacterized protein n=1 Tax=Chara braunii TaxID=69332 RepID=A0A388KQ13_CHABU|nr:hypothetical protein CBR_g11068 [Chara braunii]|eukprot:GBG72135.1 hypothetical protein CBR_g11068 [Chara braunii]